MKNIGIFFFSGTGNTEVISQGIQEAFHKSEYKTSLINIDITLDVDRIDLDTYDMIGIGYPVYGMGPPRIMTRFIKKLPKADWLPVFLFMTAGDNLWVNDGAGHFAKRVLRLKGYNLIYQRLFVMPPNFYLGYDDLLRLQLYKANLTKINDMVHDLKHHVSRYMKPGMLVKTVFLFINWCENNFGARGFGMSLKASDACTECGICIKNCPMGNISFKNQDIKIGMDCTFCMRCIYTCPMQAIETKLFSFTTLDQPYNGKDILNDYLKRPDISLHNLADESNDPKYEKRYKHFEEYLKNPKL